MAVYEIDGTEMPPIPPEELEYIGEVGGEFDETSVTLSVYSTELDREYVSKLLGVQPTKSWNPHERHQFGRHGRTRILEWGKWYLSTDCDGSPVEQKITTLLAQCTNDLQSWQHLSSIYEIWLTIGGHLDNWNRELDISVETLQLLAERHLSLKIDVYFDGDDELKVQKDTSQEPTEGQKG